MERSLMKLFIFLLITVDGTGSSTVTINVMKNSSVTLTCSSYYYYILRKCDCPSNSQDCNRCTIPQRNYYITTSNNEYHYTLSGLQLSDSGLYGCFSSYGYSQEKYRLNVTEGPDSTLVIGAVGQSVVMSCGTDPGPEASEKRWCRSSNGTVCQPDTVMSHEHQPKGNVTVLQDSLEIHHLTRHDIGFYRCTHDIQNQTKVHLVELQVKDKSEFLQILPVQVQPKTEQPFKILCQYSQDLKEYSKSWLCDGLSCPDTVRIIDDRFQSALVLTIDQVACSTIRSFACVAKKPGRSINSNAYRRPLNLNAPMELELGQNREKMTRVSVKAYSELKVSCMKKFVRRYRERDRGRYDPLDRWNDYYDTETPFWCKISGRDCVNVKDKTTDDSYSVTLRICVTPKDNGTIYRCQFKSRDDTKELTISVFVPAPEPPPPYMKPPIIVTLPSPSSVSPVGGILIISSVIFLIMIGIAVVRYKDLGKKLTECWASRTPLQSDAYADMYANSVAHYYRRQVHPPAKQAEDDKETSSDSDDEFEQLPDRARHKDEEEETEYMKIKPGMLRKDAPAAPPDQAVIECEGVAKGNEEDEDDEDEVTYTHVTIRPKRPPK